jgi:hypothetical protein
VGYDKGYITSQNIYNKTNKESICLPSVECNYLPLPIIRKLYRLYLKDYIYFIGREGYELILYLC